MNDLISRRAAIKAIDDLPNCYNGYSDTYDKAYIIGTLEELPSVEQKKVVEDYCRPRNLMVVAAEDFHRLDAPKRGKWIKDGDAYALYKCSVCNDVCPAVGYADCIPEERMYKIMKYCPNCGARMERREE